MKRVLPNTERPGAAADRNSRERIAKTTGMQQPLRLPGCLRVRNRAKQAVAHQRRQQQRFLAPNMGAKVSNASAMPVELLRRA